MGKRSNDRAEREAIEEPVWDIIEIAALLKVHYQTVRRWMRLGTRVGRCIRQTETGRYYAFPSELNDALRS